LVGKIATSTGETHWITDSAARNAGHLERGSHDSILVGVETVLSDDPRLDVRSEAFGTQDLPFDGAPFSDNGCVGQGSPGNRTESPRHPAPRKIILDTLLRTPPGSRLFKTAGEVIIYCGSVFPQGRRKDLEAAGATVVSVGRDPSAGLSRLNLCEVLGDLASKRKCQELLVEGGARVLGSFVGQKLFDRLIYFMAPRIFGSEARDVFGDLDVKELAHSIDLQNVSTRLVGRDVMIEGFV